MAVDVAASGNTVVSAILLLKKIRADVGAKVEGTTLTEAQFEAGWDKVKAFWRRADIPLTSSGGSHHAAA